MEHPENTLDTIRAFLKGQLPPEETANFRRRIAADPALEEQVAFARLMLGGLEELAAQDRKRRWKRWVGVLAAIAAAAAALWMYQPPAPPAPLFSPMQGAAIAWNNRGEVILGGQFQDSLSLGPFSWKSFGGQDFFLAACTRDAQFRWVKPYGSAGGDDFVEKIAPDSKGNIAVTGSLFDQALFGTRRVGAKGKADNGASDFFIALFDAAGNPLWLDHAGGKTVPNKQTGANLGTAITVDAADHIIATGMYVGSPTLGGHTLPAGGPNEDLYLAKYTSGGQLLWVKTATCDYQIFANSVVTDWQGNIYLTGFFGHHNLGGRAYFDQITLRSYGGRDLFIAKYSPDGKLLWVRQAGSSNRDGRDYGQGIAVDGKGNCAVTGWVEGMAKFQDDTMSCRGGRDAFLARYDSDGHLLWVKTMGGPANDQGNAVCFDRAGNLYCTGHFSDAALFDNLPKTSAGDDDIFIAKYDPRGALLWFKQAGGAMAGRELESAHDIAINAGDTLVVTGVFSGQLQIDRQVVADPGVPGLFLFFFDRQGKLIGVRRIA